MSRVLQCKCTKATQPNTCVGIISINGKVKCYVRAYSGVWNFMTFEGILFKKWTAVVTASGQYQCGTFMPISNTVAVSNMRQFSLSATLFYYGIWVQDISCIR